SPLRFDWSARTGDRAGSVPARERIVRPSCRCVTLQLDLVSYETKLTSRTFSVKPSMEARMSATADLATKPSASLWDNPMGTDGFEFVEYTALDTRALARLFEMMGFTAIARHRSKDVTLYRQGDVNFVLDAEPDSFAQAFARIHGPSVCAMAFRVRDADKAYKRAIELGARPVHSKVGPMELNIPAIEGIGGSVIYLVDRYGERSIYDV